MFKFSKIKETLFINLEEKKLEIGRINKRKNNLLDPRLPTSPHLRQDFDAHARLRRTGRGDDVIGSKFLDTDLRQPVLHSFGEVVGFDGQAPIREDDAKDSNSLNIALSNNEINDQNICNPSFINSQILQYIQNNKIKNPLIILSTPYITSFEKINYKILQILLTLRKVPGEIKLITIQNIFESQNRTTNLEINKQKNLLEPFYPPPKTNPTKWLILTATSLFMMLVCSSYLAIAKKSRINAIEAELKDLKQQNVMLAKDAKALNIEKTKNETLKKFESKIARSNNVIKIIDFLNQIEQIIPENSALSKLELTKHKASKNIDITYSHPFDCAPSGLRSGRMGFSDNFNISIEGATSDKSEIITFLESLKNQKNFEKVELSSAQKAKNLYNFKICTKSNYF